MFPAGGVTGGVPCISSGAGEGTGEPVSCVIHPGKKTIAMRRTEQKISSWLRMIDVISFKK
jgi:hypothetical protein